MTERKRGASCVMVLGTSSGAGKSLLTTALCCWLSSRDRAVVPFKAYTMSNNARVVSVPAALRHIAPREKEHGGSESCAKKEEAADVPRAPCPGAEMMGEIGAAQFVQALACGVAPTVAMNPVLFKPESGGCDVIVYGVSSRSLVACIPPRDWNAALWPYCQGALKLLQSDPEVEVLIMEGMGSCSEINLDDYANLRCAREADAACLLVTDLDRGGAFAHLLGTFLLLSERDQSRVRGFVLNRVPEEAAVRAMLLPGIVELQRRTGVPTVGMIPVLPQDSLLDEEDVAWHSRHKVSSAMPISSHSQGHISKISIVAYPYMSNSDEFTPLLRWACQQEGHVLSWARCPDDLCGSDLVILPGSKDTVKDLEWIRTTGIDAALVQLAPLARIMGICGGLQMLGTEIALKDSSAEDTQAQKHVPCLGHLRDVQTVFCSTDKKLLKWLRVGFVHCSTATADNTLWGPVFAGLHASGVVFDCYEIHHGRSSATCQGPEGVSDDRAVLTDLDSGLAAGWIAGNVFGTYAHGLFQSEDFCRALGMGNVGGEGNLTRIFDNLAQVIERNFVPNLAEILNI
jgi:adenosylcobyric acid synthase